MKKIRVGLIGAGWVAKQHLEIITHSQGMEAVGITSRTKKRAEALADEYKIPVCADNLASLVDKTKPDALMVLVTQDQMYKVTSMALACKLPVFIEKPAGLTPRENYKLMMMAKKYKVPNMVGFNRRYYSVFRKGLEIMRQHGPLLGVSVEGHERMWRIREQNQWSDYVLSKWIFANSVHTIDLLRFFGGEAQNIRTLAHSFKEASGDQFAALMELKNGAIGQYSSFWYSPGGWKVVLYGQNATVEFSPLEKGSWTDRDFKVHEILPDDVDVKFKPGFFRQLEIFCNLARGGKLEWPAQDLEGSYRTMCLVGRLCSKVSKFSPGRQE